MKSFVCAVLLVVVVAAEPPNYRQVKFRSVREEPAAAEKSTAENAPYAAAGFKPTKEFNLPVRQELSPPAASYGTPDDSYGAPFNTYLAPQVEYGPPKAKTAERRKDGKKEGDSESVSVESAESGSSESKESESEESGKKKANVEKKGKEEKGEKKEKTEKSEKKDEKKEKANLEDASKNDAVISTKGAYFVLLPTSQLQRVQYQTQSDLTKMAYTASLQYVNEKAPVYIYTPTPQYQPVQQPVVAAYSYAW